MSAHVLVADDERLVRDLAAGILEGAGGSEAPSSIPGLVDDPRAAFPAKPFRPAQLVGAVANLLGARRGDASQFPAGQIP